MKKMHFLFFFILGFIYKTYGTTYYMNDNNTTGDFYCTAAGNNANDGLTPSTPKLTLAAVYALASAGDTILIDTGTYDGSTNRFLDTNPINKIGLQIIGAGEDLTIFTRTSGTNIRWLTLAANDIKISRMTVTNFNAGSDGIAIRITSGIGIVLSNLLIYANIGSAGQGAVLITGNSTSVTINKVSSHCNRVAAANFGGGYKISGSTVVLNECTVESNIYSAGEGGGMLIEGNTANVTINKTSFENNEADAGGGLAIYNGTINVNNSCFKSNFCDTASLLGGGGVLIKAQTNGTTTNINFNNCSFEDNYVLTASSDGGGVSITNLNSPTCNVTFESCSFKNNSAADKGEDIYFENVFSPTFNVTFKNTTFETLYSGTKVNLYNQDFPAAQIKFETLAGAGGNGDIVADGSGIAITNPEMTGVYTESSSAVPVGLPLTYCEDRFIGSCASGFSLFCTRPAILDDDITPPTTNVGFSTHSNLQSENWPHNIPNGLLVLESKSKGFVLTRMTTTERNTIATPVAGMLIYNTTDHCLQIFNGVTWRCMVETCVD